MEQIETSNFTSSLQLLNLKSKNSVSKAKSSTRTVYCSTLKEHHMYKPTAPKQVSSCGARKQHYQIFQLNTFWGAKNILAATFIAYLPYVPLMDEKNYTVMVQDS